MTDNTEDGERADSPSRAARRLSALVYTDLNFEVDDAALGEFIRRRWARIAPLAHIIHDAPDQTKNPGGTTPVGGNLPNVDAASAEARRQKAVASLRHYIASMEMNEGLLRASSLREILGELEA